MKMRLAVVVMMVGALGLAWATPWTPQDAPPSSPYEIFDGLVEAIAKTDGCLGVETAESDSGKSVIFAWFEDKDAVLRWHGSAYHQSSIKMFFPEGGAREALAHIPDDVGPVMAIASITLADAAHFEATSLPISQIAIELYKPLDGGLFLGSRFAPQGLKVGDMRDYTPR